MGRGEECDELPRGCVSFRTPHSAFRVSKIRVPSLAEKWFTNPSTSCCADSVVPPVGIATPVPRLFARPTSVWLVARSSLAASLRVVRRPFPPAGLVNSDRAGPRAFADLDSSAPLAFVDPASPGPAASDLVPSFPALSVPVPFALVVAAVVGSATHTASSVSHPQESVAVHL